MQNHQNNNTKEVGSYAAHTTKKTNHPDLDGRKLIGIDGYWYDVTSFIPHHPGGDVITKFIGKDASAVFHAFHKESVLKHRQPVAPIDDAIKDRQKIGLVFTHLRKFFENEGYFEVNYYWYTIKFLTSFIPLLCCLYLVLATEQTYLHYLAGVFLAAFWQQCGFFMHDFEHNQFTGNRHIDRKLGAFFGTFCFGISAAWWRDEHFIHHALTTTVDYESEFCDPQMFEPIWAQNKKLWPFFKTRLQYYCIKMQHITFLPACIVIGRIGIMIDSIKQEKRVTELIAFGLHWLWMAALLSSFPNMREAIIFYIIASLCQGILHIQLLISHYAKPFHELKDISNTTDWYKLQVESNIDITNPWWLDWFHGGLNFHLMHHLYPRMPRHNYRQATEYLKQACTKCNLNYDHCSWTEAVYRTLKQLKLMSHHYKLDPR